jgi:hypothetical protein
MYSAPSTSTLDAKGNFYWFYAGPKTTLQSAERLAAGEVAFKQIGGEGTTP